MKILKITGLVCLALLMSLTVLAEKGPVPDKVYFDVRMQEDIGLRDVAEGTSDIFYHGVAGNLISGLDQKTLSKLEIYDVPSGTWSLLFNPYPNTAPYHFEKDGKTIFNPFAIREIRFAMNFLINRQYIVDEILGGAGGPMYTMATPGQPGTYKYNMLANKFGYTPEGDEERALADIEAAMEKAAALPKNKGRLKKEGKWWTFDGEPVTIKFYIRVDDPNGRTKEGEYVSQQLEKAGLKVDRLMWDRFKIMSMVYGAKPEDWTYSIYTEGWGAGATRRYWEHIVAQMYAPWYGYMPGGYTEGWKYENDRLDELTQKAYTGKAITEEEYWDWVLEGLELGLEDAVRIYVCYQNQYFVANKSRFNGRFAYGLGDGLSKYSLITADTKDGIVRATQFSAKGSLFMQAWDPVGPDGFSDTYTNNIAMPLYDPGAFESPASGNWEFAAVSPVEVKSDVEVDANGEVVGKIPVATNAIKYDTVEKKWVKVDEGLKSFSKGRYDIKLMKFHHGIQMSLVDYLYAEAFRKEWITEDFEGDPYYDEGYASYAGGSDIFVAAEYDFENNQIVEYFDFQFPAGENRVAGRGAPLWTASAKDPNAGASWEINEALARMVVDGGASGEKYSFKQSAEGEGAVEVDVIRPTCVADIKAELEEMIAEKHVPISIKDFITVDEAVARYQAALDFIAKYGHAYISNGPFILTKVDPVANFIELTANRDESYPFEPGYWMEQLKTTRLEVDELELPVMVEKGEDILVNVYVSSIVYPEKEGELAKEGDVKLLLIAGDKEYEFEADAAIDGVFVGKIPGNVTKDLTEGSYTVMAIAKAEGATPSTVTSNIILY